MVRARPRSVEPYAGASTHHGLPAWARSPQHRRMPTLIFWLLVVAGIVFFQLTTRAERRAMIETYWVLIALLGAFGLVWQLLRQGTISS